MESRFDVAFGNNYAEIPPIRKRVMEMTQEHDNDYYEFMRLADSVMKIDKGRYQNKVMKEISNMFLLGESK